MNSPKKAHALIENNTKVVAVFVKEKDAEDARDAYQLYGSPDDAYKIVETWLHE